MTNTRAKEKLAPIGRHVGGTRHISYVEHGACRIARDVLIDALQIYVSSLRERIVGHHADRVISRVLVAGGDVQTGSSECVYRAKPIRRAKLILGVDLKVLESQGRRGPHRRNDGTNVAGTLRVRDVRIRVDQAECSRTHGIGCPSTINLQLRAEKILVTTIVDGAVRCRGRIVGLQVRRCQQQPTVGVLRAKAELAVLREIAKPSKQERPTAGGSEGQPWRRRKSSACQPLGRGVGTRTISRWAAEPLLH